jgi:sortase B
MKAEMTGKKAIKAVNSIVNLAVLTIILLLIIFAGYALWDSNQIYEAADKSHYAAYKPTKADEGKSFQELQALNAEVFAWLSVYGTNIDYPVTQGRDNMKYVNTNAEGLYSLSGAIFLDCGNNKDFSDFNNILYGHHMAKKVMFGEIGEFSDKKMFDSHQYGNLYFDEKDHGIEFFAFVHTDAYDGAVFAPGVGEGQQQAYLDGLLAKAIHKRDIGVTTQDRILLLSTCSSSSTNGRDILIGRITEEVYADSTLNSEMNDGSMNQSGLTSDLQLSSLLLELAVMLLAGRILVIVYKRKFKKRSGDT